MTDKKYIITKGKKPDKCMYCKNILREDNKSKMCNICFSASPKERMARRNQMNSREQKPL